MKVVLQRVSRASVTVDNNIVGNIDKGYVVLLGVSEGDNISTVEKMVDKIQKLRIFPDENGKTNLSITDVGGSILVISQFTLYADCSKGRRPSFHPACAPQKAAALYDKVCAAMRSILPGKVQSGIFAADMDVSLTNWGPVTLVLDSGYI